jgi:hypothetical protein
MRAHPSDGQLSPGIAWLRPLASSPGSSTTERLELLSAVDVTELDGLALVGAQARKGHVVGDAVGMPGMFHETPPLPCMSNLWALIIRFRRPVASGFVRPARTLMRSTG